MQNPRKKAVEILMNIEKNGAYSNIEMNKLRSTNEFSYLDLRFIGEIVNGVIKRKITLDYIISKHSSVKLKKISPFLLAVLRSGAYQILYMTKVPASAAVNESVKLVKKSSVYKSASFVNAILRKVSENDLPKKDSADIKNLSVFYSFPEWLCERWVERYGVEFTEKLMDSFNSRPSMFVRRSKILSQKELQSELKDEGIACQEFVFEDIPEFDYSLKLNRMDELDKSKAFANGHFYIQDPAAALAAYLLSPNENDTVIDMCAAPGGKSLFVADLMNNKGRVISCDIYEHKIKLIKSNAEKYGANIIEPIISDATVFNHEFEEIADRVLCDVPCSGLGIIGKKPDIRYTRCPEDIKSLSKLGLDILNNASCYLKSGGILVYSTCTIEPEENEETVNSFLACHPEFSILPFGNNHSLYKTFYPHIDGCDGFFVCRLQKKK